ncbi:MULTISPECIES: hypothetical protein [Phaeobacter]|uniref:hypothetical protein n=1 Tax=Phaeobacter TaxID=302485 RepID=UPI000C9ADD5C|nr:hypothetical protein [Phaeobacter inhibens]AUR03877.1 hypothetical protein PhaeoP72_01904 [Phaeobacter inhibens]
MFDFFCGSKGADWAAIISAGSAFLALVFSIFQWKSAKSESSKRDSRDQYLALVHQPVGNLVEKFDDLEEDLRAWTQVGNSVAGFDLIEAKITRLCRQLARELNVLEDGPLHEHFDWFTIEADELLETLNSVDPSGVNLTFKTISGDIRRLVNQLELGRRTTMRKVLI